MTGISKPKVLVAISSCQAYENDGRNQSLRDTWLPELKWDYKFFHGQGSQRRDDVVNVDCNDAYYDLTSKTKLKCKWGVEHGYDFIFCCFPDMYARPERLELCGFEQHYYFGTTSHNCPGGCYCQGGPGYFLSRRAAELIANCGENYPNEDCFVANILLRAGVKPIHCDGFKYLGPGPLKTNDVITNHLSVQPDGFTVACMHAEHDRWLNS